LERELSSVEPFEICSIRPPTENCSLTFRLTRNCYWNRCKFCPVYKLGARFQKRALEDVLADIKHARRIDDLLFDEGVVTPFYTGNVLARADALAEKIRAAKGEFLPQEDESQEYGEDPDPRIAWFMQWFKDKPNLRDSFSHVASWRVSGGQTCFLGDADGLILKPDFASRVIDQIRTEFTSITRFTMYGRTKTATSVRTIKDLKAFRKAGLHRVHFGVESGSDEVLAFMDKGATSSEHIEAGIRTRDAGLSCSVYVMPGLGGRTLSQAHAKDTAAVLTKMSPDYIRLRSLEIFPRTPLEEAVKNGVFTEASEEEVVKEIRTIVEETRCSTEILSDSASNLLQVGGRLPDDRDAMLGEIDSYLVLGPREKKLFSIQARLQSFIGQYGGISYDIACLLNPYRKADRLDFHDASDDELDTLIRMVRSRLMP